MKKLFLILINICLLLIIIITVYFFVVQKDILFAESNYFFNNKKTLDIEITEKIQKVKREKPEEKEINALYLTSYSGSSEKKIKQMIDFVKDSKINAFVIDIKDYSGTIAYDSQIDIINELETDRNLIKDIPALIELLHSNNIYAIARQTVFQDPEITKKKPEWAVKNINTGGIWYDYNGLAWADPTNKEVWEYNLNIAKEAINLGFDEINFDYIRFPSDGPMKAMGFANLEGRAKHEVIKEFFAYLHENLKDEPAYISGDLFGFTTERDDDMNIGQVLEDAVLYFDYVCPMVYPSHYPSGYLNLSNPAANPYEVISHSIAKGIESMATVENPRAKIRPWLQAFNMGAVYTPSMIDLQIQANSENGGYGYLLWNARNVYNYVPR